MAYQEMSTEMKELANIARQIERLHSRMIVASSRAYRYVSAVKALWNELDEICCRLYQFTDAEKALVMPNQRKDRNYA